MESNQFQIHEANFKNQLATIKILRWVRIKTFISFDHAKTWRETGFYFLTGENVNGLVQSKEIEVCKSGEINQELTKLWWKNYSSKHQKITIYS